MDNKKKVLLIALVFVLLLGGAYVLYNRLSQQLAPEQLAIQAKQPTEDTGVENRQEETKPASIPAPDFTVYDADGNEVRLSDFFGKPIVLNFWASWCGPCKMEMPDFQERYLALGEDVQFLMINMTDGSRETVDSATGFIEENEYTFPVYFDTESDAAYTYGAYSLPTTYFIDAEGNAVARGVGALSAADLQRGIDMITS